MIQVRRCKLSIHCFAIYISVKAIPERQIRSDHEQMTAYSFILLNTVFPNIILRCCAGPMDVKSSCVSSFPSQSRIMQV